jgi:hypothetical protein
MRIVSFRRDGKISYGSFEGDEIADLPGLDPQLPPALNDALPTLRDYVPPAAARTPPRFLRPGDSVVISIDGVTELTNPVVGEA